MYKFKVLSQDEKNDNIVSFLKGQEFDYHCNLINLERYLKLLEILEEGPFKEKIKQSIEGVENSMKEVKAIIDCTIPQLPSDEEIEKSIIRLNNKEK